MNYVKFRDNLELSSDGDSFECEVTCGIDTALHGGYGFSQNPVQSNKIAIGVAYENLNVRADDGEYILQYKPYKWHYKFKIQYSGTDILFYVDDELVSTYDNTGGKTVSISQLGYVSTTYGYWNGTIHWLKVNGELYTSNYSVIHTEDKPSTSPMLAAKSDDELIVYRELDELLYIAFPMIHATKTYAANQYPSYYDNWGLRQPYVCYWNGTSMMSLATLFRNGEAEIAIQVKDANNNMTYVGGSTHGFENITLSDGYREFSIIIDNKAVGEDDEFALKQVGEVVIRQYSELVPAYMNSNPFADVVKIWKFGEDISIYSSVKFTRSITSDRIMQGMFCVYRHINGSNDTDYLTDRAIKNNRPYVIYDVSDGWDSLPENDGLKEVDHGCSQIYEYGDTPLGFSMSIKDDNRDATGGMFVATNATIYNKIYYAAKYGESVVQSDTEYHATQIWSFL